MKTRINNKKTSNSPWSIGSNKKTNQTKSRSINPTVKRINHPYSLSNRYHNFTFRKLKGKNMKNSPINMICHHQCYTLHLNQTSTNTTLTFLKCNQRMMTPFKKYPCLKHWNSRHKELKTQWTVTITSIILIYLVKNRKVSILPNKKILAAFTPNIKGFLPEPSLSNFRNSPPNQSFRNPSVQNSEKHNKLKISTQNGDDSQPSLLAFTIPPQSFPKMSLPTQMLFKNSQIPPVPHKPLLTSTTPWFKDSKRRKKQKNKWKNI